MDSVGPQRETGSVGPRRETGSVGPRRETGSVESEDSGLPPTDRSDNEPSSQHSYPVQSSFKYLRI